MSDHHFDQNPPDREQQLADNVLERDAGENYNPNNESEIERHRAEFDAVNERLREDRQHIADDVAPMLNQIAQDAKVASEQPEHQEMIAHQQAHHAQDRAANTAGKQYADKHPATLHDAATTPQPAPSEKEIAHPNGPIVPIQSGSSRKDT